MKYELKRLPLLFEKDNIWRIHGYSEPLLIPIPETDEEIEELEEE